MLATCALFAFPGFAIVRAAAVVRLLPSTRYAAIVQGPSQWHQEAQGEEVPFPCRHGQQVYSEPEVRHAGYDSCAPRAEEGRRKIDSSIGVSRAGASVL